MISDGSKRVYLSKEKPDGVVVIVELISKGRSSIQPVTAWKNTIEVFEEVWGKNKKAITTSQVAKNVTQSGYKIASNDIISHSNKKSNSNSVNSDTKKSERIIDDVVDYFGTTYSWNETGYLLTDGRRLDLSGKKYGARPGGRTQDHREVLDAYPEEEQDNMSGSEAMVDFMAKGNIRISPESNGILNSIHPYSLMFTKVHKH